MVDTKRLDDVIALRGLTRLGVAKRLGMGVEPFNNRMRKGIFGSDEIEDLVELLDIVHPEQIFFASKVN